MAELRDTVLRSVGAGAETSIELHEESDMDYIVVNSCPIWFLELAYLIKSGPDNQ
jgi:hypothetical protein